MSGDPCREYTEMSMYASVLLYKDQQACQTRLCCHFQELNEWIQFVENRETDAKCRRVKEKELDWIQVCAENNMSSLLQMTS